MQSPQISSNTAQKENICLVRCKEMGIDKTGFTNILSLFNAQLNSFYKKSPLYGVWAKVTSDFGVLPEQTCISACRFSLHLMLHIEPNILNETCDIITCNPG